MKCVWKSLTVLTDVQYLVVVCISQGLYSLPVCRMGERSTWYIILCTKRQCSNQARIYKYVIILSTGHVLQANV